MRARRTILALLAGTMLLLAGCGGGGGASDSGSEGGVSLTIWADDKYSRAIKESAARWGAENDVQVNVQAVSEDLQTVFVTASQAGKGPDLVMGAHDWIGNLVQNGAIDPLQLTDDTRAAFDELAIKGVTYNGQIYGIPYAIENVVLFRNTDLAPQAPGTMEELVAKGKELKAAGKVSEIMALPVGPNGDAYHLYPIYTSAGGYLFGKTAGGDYDPKDLGLARPEAARAFEKISELGEKGEGALKRSIAAENVTSLFTGRKTAFLLSGPWQIPDLEKSGVPYAISPIPGFRDGEQDRPRHGQDPGRRQGRRHHAGHPGHGHRLGPARQGPGGHGRRRPARLHGGRRRQGDPGPAQVGRPTRLKEHRSPSRPAPRRGPPRRPAGPPGPLHHHRRHARQDRGPGPGPGPGGLRRLPPGRAVTVARPERSRPGHDGDLLGLPLAPPHPGQVPGPGNAVPARLPGVPGALHDEHGVHELRGRPLGQQAGRHPGHREGLGDQGPRLHRLPAVHRHQGQPHLRRPGVPARRPETRAAQLGTPDGLEALPAEGLGLSSQGNVTKAPGYTVLSIGQAGAREEDLADFSVPTPNGAIVPAGLTRAFEGAPRRAYDPACDCIRDAETGQTWTADDGNGLFVDAKGDHLAQGWQVNVGLRNFTAVLTDPLIGKYFFRTLVWNFAFAALTVALTFALGLLVAIVLNHERLRGQRIYRSLLILPYAMPAFAMLLLWRDMFNTDFGLINRMFNSEVNWFGKPVTAIVAVLLVQLWMGYPYMFLVCTGALQSIPGDLKEAASVDGAKPVYAFRTIVFPLLLVALAPLLIASFAFNFNNFNAIFMVSEGGPFPPDNSQIGATDLLITYTYRLAFGAQGAQYGFAAAVSVFIFLIVAVFSIVGFRRTRALEEVN